MIKGSSRVHSEDEASGKKSKDRTKNKMKEKRETEKDGMKNGRGERKEAEDEIRRDSVSSGEDDTPVDYRMMRETPTGKSEGWGVPQSPSDDVDDDEYYCLSMLTINQKKKMLMIVMYGIQSVNSINMTDRYLATEPTSLHTILKLQYYIYLVVLLEISVPQLPITVALLS
jgi:hypothetical protein